MSNVPYSNFVRSLMYATMSIRSGICYVIRMVSRYQTNLGMMHWKAVKRILMYLKGTMDYSPCYQSKELCWVSYSNVDWASDLDECKSTSKYIFLLNNDFISWRSKKQTCIALSTMEVEFIACLATIQEVIWLSRFFQSLGIVKCFWVNNSLQ